MTNTPLKLHSFPLSGNSHRTELFLSLLNIEAEIVNVDLPNGEHKGDAFLKLNPLGQVPVLQDEALVIADSNAILVYLAEKYDTEGQWYPRDAAVRADIQRFLSIVQNQVANGPAAARLVTVFGYELDHEQTIARAHAILQTLDAHLDGKRFAVANQPTLADVALYTYIAHAPEGNVSLEPYPYVRAWLNNVEALPGFIPMLATKAGLAA